ncbi:hypothetical protein L1887_21315 [Cichorium endivia]|nr:hypothetical protein L1887_21315 [Cichorium endivia]
MLDQYVKYYDHAKPPILSKQNLKTLSVFFFPSPPPPSLISFPIFFSLSSSSRIPSPSLLPTVGHHSPPSSADFGRRRCPTVACPQRTTTLPPDNRSTESNHRRLFLRSIGCNFLLSLNQMGVDRLFICVWEPFVATTSSIVLCLFEDSLDIVTYKFLLFLRNHLFKKSKQIDINQTISIFRNSKWTVFKSLYKTNDKTIPHRQTDSLNSSISLIQKLNIRQVSQIPK